MCPSDSPSDNAVGGQGLAGARVLVVEDAWHVARALRSVLEDLGMKVIGPVADVADAERLLDQEVPELAVVDLNLRDEVAYGLIDRLHDKGVRVVVASGYSVMPASLTKVAAIVQKPFSGAALVAALQQALLDERNP
jgi:DNA-binding NtrC family response regulator